MQKEIKHNILQKRLSRRFFKSETKCKRRERACPARTTKSGSKHLFIWLFFSRVIISIEEQTTLLQKTYTYVIILL